MIWSVHIVLRILTNDCILTKEQLTIVVIEVERSINDRPLTPVSDDPHDSATLSLSAFLTGQLDTSLPPDVFTKANGYRCSFRTK